MKNLSPHEIRWVYAHLECSLTEEEFTRLYATVANGDDEQSVLTRVLISDFLMTFKARAEPPPQPFYLFSVN